MRKGIHWGWSRQSTEYLVAQTRISVKQALKQQHDDSIRDIWLVGGYCRRIHVCRLSIRYGVPSVLIS